MRERVGVPDVAVEDEVAVPLHAVAVPERERVPLRGAHERVVARLEARLAELQATAVPPVKPDGCDALTVDGALRPCDAPDPGE